MTASMSSAFKVGGGHPRFYHAIAWTGAAYSCILGVIFLFGVSDRLPSLG
jgi:high-affinity nickel-transport protein